MARRDSILVSRTLYQIGIVTLITSIVWVIIGIYLAATKPLEINIDKGMLEPITTNIDQEVVKSMADRLIIENNVPPLASESASIDGGGTQ